MMSHEWAGTSRRGPSCGSDSAATDDRRILNDILASGRLDSQEPSRACLLPRSRSARTCHRILAVPCLPVEAY